MALIARYFIDTSAAARMTNHVVAERLGPLIEAGLVGTCAVLDAEALYSARSPEEYERLRSQRRLAYQYLPTNDEHWQLALDAQRQLAGAGLHRAVGIADLLVASVAQRHDVTVLHYDSDYEVVADLIGIVHRWVAPAGSIP
jgi:predicted nucleic acid-binding protein